ncbi:MAG: thiamine diphosphokinase [Clostridia bacterium]
MGTCYIVGAGDFVPRGLAPQADALVIAADGGYRALQALHIKPDLLLGDFDSIGDLNNLPQDLPILRYPVQKDDTDTGLALAEGWARGYRDFRLYGCGGGRIDHLLANLQSMCGYSRRGAALRLIDRACDYETLTNGTLILPLLPQNAIVSVFCLGEQATGVTLRGLAYPLTNAVLTCQLPLGVSNHIKSSVEPARISVAQGTLLIAAYQEADSIESSFDRIS